MCLLYMTLLVTSCTMLSIMSELSVFLSQAASGLNLSLQQIRCLYLHVRLWWFFYRAMFLERAVRSSIKYYEARKMLYICWKFVRHPAGTPVKTVQQRSGSCPRLIVPRTRLSTIGDRSFRVTVAQASNSLPTNVTASTSLPSFKRQL